MHGKKNYAGSFARYSVPYLNSKIHVCIRGINRDSSTSTTQVKLYAWLQISNDIISSLEYFTKISMHKLQRVIFICINNCIEKLNNLSGQRKKK